MNQIKIIIVNFQGIGNNLLVVPFLYKLRDKFPEAEISYITRFAPIKELFERYKILNNIITLPPFKLKNLFKIILKLLKLRQKKFNISILTFPSNNLYMNFLHFLIYAKLRISYRYNYRFYRNLNFLNNIHVETTKDIHDFYQNILLLKPLTDNLDFKIKYNFFPVIKKYSLKAEKILKKIKNGKFVIGIHPGSSIENRMIYKRWDRQNYISLINKIARNRKIHILLFGGREEEKLKKFIYERIIPGLKKRVSIINEHLLTIVYIIKHCKLFITNDSLLMHVAALQNVRVISISGGPTDVMRTFPWRGKNFVFHSNIHCYPCRSIINIGKKFKCIYPDIRCLATIKESEVERLINKFVPI